MNKRILHNGQFFTDAFRTLEECAEFSRLPLAELSFHPDDIADELRQQRNECLTVVDRYQGALSFAALAVDQQTELANYRQALLDAPQLGTLPDAPTWLK